MTLFIKGKAEYNRDDNEKLAGPITLVGLLHGATDKVVAK